MKVRLFLQWLSRRSVIVVTALLIAVAVLLLWFLSAGFTPSTDQVIIGIAAISALLAAISAIANLLQAVEVQKQRQSQERPYVTAYFDGASSGAIYFVIENSGNSPALDVRFQFTPAPVDFAGRSLDQVSLFAKPITFLPASKVMRQIVDVGYKFLADGKPTKFSITVSYASVYREVFQETVEHDLEYLKQATVPGKTVEDYLKTVSEELKSLVHLLQSVRGSNSLLVETPEQYYDRLERDRDEVAETPKQKRRAESILRWVLSKLPRGSTRKDDRG